LNKVGIGQSRICHADFVQTTVDNKLVITPCPLTYGAYDEAEAMFNICVNVWTYVLKDNHEQWGQLRAGNQKNKIKINLHRNVDNIYKFINKLIVVNSKIL